MAIIRSEIYLWAKSIDNTKLASGYHSVQHLGILPPFHRKQSHVIRCIIPHSGRLKLNTDVADGRTFAAGGAILRNSTGECIGTLSFCLPISTPYHAELQTAYFAMLFFYLFIGTSFQKLTASSWFEILLNIFMLLAIFTFGCYARCCVSRVSFSSIPFKKLTWRLIIQHSMDYKHLRRVISRRLLFRSWFRVVSSLMLLHGISNMYNILPLSQTVFIWIGGFKHALSAFRGMQAVRVFFFFGYIASVFVWIGIFGCLHNSCLSLHG